MRCTPPVAPPCTAPGGVLLRPHCRLLGIAAPAAPGSLHGRLRPPHTPIRSASMSTPQNPGWSTAAAPSAPGSPRAPLRAQTHPGLLSASQPEKPGWPTAAATRLPDSAAPAPLCSLHVARRCINKMKSLSCCQSPCAAVAPGSLHYIACVLNET